MKAIVFIHDENPDKNSEMVDIGGLSWRATGIVPIRLNFEGDPIGEAVLRRDGNAIMAEFFPSKALTGKYFPAIGFKVIESATDPATLILKVSKAEIREVSLCQSNADERIQPVDFTPAPPALIAPKNRVLSIHIMDSNARFDKDIAWSISADIVVPGLGQVSIKDCLSQETIDKVCAEVLFALKQKMGVKA